MLVINGSSSAQSPRPTTKTGSKQLNVHNLTTKLQNNKPNLTLRDENIIDKREVNAGILQAQASHKMQDIIDLAPEAQHKWLRNREQA